MKYGYARVSTKNQAKDGNSLEIQEKELRKNGAEEIFSDVYTGTTTARPELQKLLLKIQPGDTFMVTKLDRMARSITEGLELIQTLQQKNIIVDIFNMGKIDNTPNGKLMLNIFLSFAEFERDMIVQRTTEGRRAAYEKGVKFGRPRKTLDDKTVQDILSYLHDGKSVSSIARTSKVSRATIYRYARMEKFKTI